MTRALPGLPLGRVHESESLVPISAERVMDPRIDSIPSGPSPVPEYLDVPWTQPRQADPRTTSGPVPQATPVPLAELENSTMQGMSTGRTGSVRIHRLAPQVRAQDPECVGAGA